VETASTEALSGAVTLKLADLTLSGTIKSGGIWQGRGRWMIAGGAGAWGSTVDATSYTNDAGTKLTTVVRELATQIGETFTDTTTTTRIGSRYARQQGPASRSLELLSPRAWYVDTDGETKLGARADSDYEGKATRVSYDAESDRLELAANTISDILPGVTIDSVRAVDVVHELRDRKLRTVVWGNSINDNSRVPEALRQIFEALDPARKYRAQWEYRITSQDGDVLNLQIARVSSGMPDLQRVRVRPGIPGMSATNRPGSLVVVTFINGDSTRPAVVAFDSTDSPGFLPIDLELGSAPRSPAVRTSDTIQCGAFGGRALTGSADVKIGGVPTVV
jgi:hypothetical protein